MDDSAVRSVTVKFVEAYRRRDAAAAAELYADDAKVLPPNLPMVTGKAAIRDFWQFAMDMGAGANLEAEELLVEGGLACERGVITIAMQPGTPQEKVTRGKYVIVMRQGPDGTWKLVLDIWNGDPA